MKTALYASLVLLIALAVPLGSVLAAPAPKADVCHLDKDSGTYILINISENAVPAHVDHGDAGPGELVPGVPGKKFAADCSLVDLVDVTGMWRGEIGGIGCPREELDMVLVQSPSGDVTGTVNYDTGIVLTVTGTILGYEFAFVAQEVGSPPPPLYWADCTPCIVNVNGDYLQGSGEDSDGHFIQWMANKQ